MKAYTYFLFHIKFEQAFWEYCWSNTSSPTGPNKFQRGITPTKLSQPEPKSNLICITTGPINILNFKSLSQRISEKSLENWIISKRHNSCKTRSTETKIELDLYYHRTNSYTKFFKSISQGMSKKKSENWNVMDTLRNGQTNSEKIKSPPGKPVGV